MTTLNEINEAIADDTLDDIVRVSEARQVKALSAIADRITARGSVRVVLLAGGSSAGKTTTSKRLVVQLAVNGIKALSMSTDDYFVGDALNPRDENGEFDYETVEAVDRGRLVADLRALIAGESVEEHRFDFQAHEPYDTGRWIRLAEGGIIVLEGIHALNPVLVPGLDESQIYRIYVSPVNLPYVAGSTRLTPQQCRLFRRIVRDNRFRKLEAHETMRLWPKVLAGERKWIDPFVGNADDVFDSALDYELAVLKPYVEGLLTLENVRYPGNAEVELLLRILDCVEVGSGAAVPGDSILRETIGGSQLEY